MDIRFNDNQHIFDWALTIDITIFTSRSLNVANNIENKNMAKQISNVMIMSVFQFGFSAVFRFRG